MSSLAAHLITQHNTDKSYVFQTNFQLQTTAVQL